MSSRVLPARKTSARRKRRQGITKPLRFYRAGTVFSTRGPWCGSAMGRRCLGTRNPGRESRFGRGVGASRLRVGPRARPLAFARWSAHVQPLAFARWSARSMFHVRPSRTSPHPRTSPRIPHPPRTTRPRARSSSGRFDSRVPICARILSNAAFFHRMVCIIQNASFLCICTNRR